jgi:phosphoglycerate dehydrogenase-like enzyme
MADKLVILRDDSVGDDWAGRIRAAAPEMEVRVARTRQEAMREIVDADAAYGTVDPELFRRARKLRWIQAPAIAPPVGYYHKALIKSDVVVTNIRGVFNDHLPAHIMAFVLAFARGFHHHFPNQMRREWKPDMPVVHLPEATALIIGVGGTGAEAARLCAEFGMKVLGMDPRVESPPAGVAELHKPEALHSLLPRADFVIMTVPHTPETEGLMALREFRLMRRTAYLINVGRGGTVVLDELTEAIRSGLIAGAGLDVFQIEPLPREHPLWKLPGVMMTPHCAGAGPYTAERHFEIFLDNCKRFAEGRPFRNIVDKVKWY